jgi:ATP-dependent DNA helicase RecG
MGAKSALSWHQVGTKLALSEQHVAKILDYCLEERPIADIMALFDRKDRTKFKETFINPLLEEDLLMMTSPGKPRSSKQTYITTSNGKNLLEFSPLDLGTKSALSWDYVTKILEYCF